MIKYALGTAQFGLDYGINNDRGKVPSHEVNEILTVVSSAGIDMLDTAYGYGESEEVIGEFNSRHPDLFKIVTKLPDCGSQEAAGFFEQSLDRLKRQSVYGLLIHHFNEFEKDKGLWHVLKQLKSQGKVNKIGFSLYYPKDLKKLFEDGLEFDLIQVPYNIFDRRFEPYLGELKDRGVEVHVRSVFLQGLIFKKPDDLNENFSNFRHKLASLNALSERCRIPVWAVAMNFAVLNKNIDRVIMGVDRMAHLNSWVHAEQFLNSTQNILSDLNRLQEYDEQVILPLNWK